MKDVCWALQFKVLGVCMIVPTLYLAIIISIKTRRNTSEFLPNAAIALWIIANSIWMCDEFFGLGIKKACYIPFVAGLLIIAYWCFFYFPSIWKEYSDLD
jgi:hypothetical protein